MPSNVELVAFTVYIKRTRALSGYVERTMALVVRIERALSVTGYIEKTVALEVEL